MSSIILLGSTGAVGKNALLSALHSPAISQVHSFGRSAPKNVSPSTPGFDKLTHTSFDYEALLKGDEGEARKLAQVEADSVVIAHGTNRKLAGSAEAFVRIDREYVLAAARAARVEGKEQSVVYCSSAATSSRSRFLYGKSKGLTEEGLAALDYSQTTILRPAALIKDGPKSGWWESAFGFVMINLVAPLSDQVAVPVEAVGETMICAATTTHEKLASEGRGHQVELRGKKAWYLTNKDILLASRQSWT